jgi:hypothetical protein
MSRFLVSIILICISWSLPAQNDPEMFKQKRERKRLWRKHHGNRERKNKKAFNPYLEKKASDKPSARMARGNRNELRMQKRLARRQMRKSKKKVNN